MSIRSKLITLFLTVALIPASLISILTFKNYKSSIEAAHISALSNIAAYKAERIETYFNGLRANIQIAQSFFNIKTNLPVLTRFANQPADPAFVAATKMLDEQIKNTTVTMGVHDIMLLNLEGKKVYASDPAYFALNFQNDNKDILKRAFECGKQGICFSEVFPDREKQGDYAMLVSGPARDFKGRLIGVIEFSVDMDQVYALIQDTTGMGVTGETLVGELKGDNVVFLNPLRHAPDAALNKQLKLGVSVGVPIQLAVQGKTGAGQLHDYRGEDVIASWSPIRSVNWGMVAKIDVAEAFSEEIRMRNVDIIIVSFTIVLCAIVAVWFSRTIAGPINKLSQGAEIIGSGNLDYTVGTGGRDEIARLSRSFDKMTRDLKMTTASRDELNCEINIRKRAEEELLRSNENLEQFAYVASHDLQEPLRMMSSYSSMLERRYRGRLDKDADEFIGYIVDGATRMQALINDLLAFSRVGRIESEVAPVALNKVLLSVKEGLSAAIRDCGAVITNDELPTLLGVESHYMQLFLNLIGNAIKFRGAAAPLIHVGAQKEGSSWEFCVQDNGIGIEPQYFDRVFLIFQRLHGRGQYPGTGIGLAICKKIVESEGGRIWVESEPGKGTKFCFTIPAEKGV